MGILINVDNLTSLLIETGMGENEAIRVAEYVYAETKQESAWLDFTESEIRQVCKSYPTTKESDLGEVVFRTDKGNKAIAKKGQYMVLFHNNNTPVRGWVNRAFKGIEKKILKLKQNQKDIIVKFVNKTIDEQKKVA